MITLITGLPGNGKTLYALSWLKGLAEKDGRTVYYSGINDCRVPGWIEGDAEKWMDLPSGSIILVDEVQRIMRPRQHGTTVPPFVAALETHRHKGVDLVLITQHPMLLDSNVRRLVGQHFHVIRKFGTHLATIHEWNAVKENCDKNREDSIKHEWKFPKESFALYKSAEVHTHKRRIPMKVWVLLATPLLIGGAAWYAWHKVSEPKKPPINAFTGKPIAEAQGAGIAVPGVHLTRAAYLEQYAPRVAGLAHTAPVYDDLTKPVEVPYPAACVDSEHQGCRCYTQQATRLEVPAELCRNLVAKGFFVEWQQKAPIQGQPLPVSSPTAPQTFSPSAPVGFYASKPAESPSASILPPPPSGDQLPPGLGRPPSSRPKAS